MPLARNNQTLQPLGGQILSNGGHFVSADLKDVLFDSPEVRDAVDLIKELAQYTPPGATTWGSPDQVGAIVNGTCAMGMYLGRVFGNLVTMNPSLIGKMSNTIVPYNKQPSNWGGAYAHGVLKSSKSPEAAKEIIKFSMRKEQYIAWMLTTPGYYAAEIPAYGADPSYTGSPVLKAFDPKLLATLADSEKYSFDFLNEGPGWQSNPKAGTLEGSLFYADVVQKVVIGKESTQSAVTFGANAIRDIMKG
jgi:multiple sugar transport system substrate-binding protein